MPNIIAFFADRISAKSQRDVAWIAVFSAAVLAVSSSIAWVLHSGVTKATAQSGQQIAATVPDRQGDLLRLEQAAGPSAARTTAARIDRITLEDQKPSLIEGRAPARANVSVSLAGKVIGAATASADGNWSLAVERGLGAGDHRLSIRTGGSNGGEDNIDTARISVPRGLLGPLVINYQGVDLVLPRAASNAANADTRLAQAPAVSGTPKARLDTAGSSPIVLAQSTPAPAPTQPAAPSTAGSALDALQSWLRRANDTYQKAIVKRLTEPSTLDEIEARTAAEEAKKAADAKPAEPKTSEPKASEPKAAETKAAEPKTAEPAAPDPKIAEDAARKREELRAAQAKRDEDLRQAEAKKKAADDLAAKEAAAKAPPAAAPAVDDVARKQAEDKRIADETIKRQADLKAAEDKRAAEAKKAADDAASKSAEEKRAADAKKAADDAASKSAEAKKAADDAVARKQADEKRLAEEAQKRLADENQKRLLDENQKRQADLKAAEEKRAADANARKQADDKRAADAKKAADDAVAKSAEAKKAADDAAARKQAEDRRIAEEAAKRLADAKRVADEKRLEADAAKRAADDAKRAGDQVREAEARRQAELKAAEDAKRNAAALAEAASKSAKPANPGVAMVAPKAAPERATAPEPASPQASGPVEPLRMSRSSRRTKPVAVAAAPARRSAKAKQSCELAGNRTTPPGYYIVKAGDTLWDIADMHYDDGTRFALLQRANRRIDPDLIRPCQRIFVPTLAKRG
jgi:nucleoid-associated protein YgaU